MAIIEGREAIAAYMYMSPATLYRQTKKHGIPVQYADGIDRLGRGHKIMTADTKELDDWKRRQEAKHGRD